MQSSKDNSKYQNFKLVTMSKFFAKKRSSFFVREIDWYKYSIKLGNIIQIQETTHHHLWLLFKYQS